MKTFNETVTFKSKEISTSRTPAPTIEPRRALVEPGRSDGAELYNVTSLTRGLRLSRWTSDLRSRSANEAKPWEAGRLERHLGLRRGISVSGH